MNRMLHELLEVSAHRNPNGIAVVDRDRSITYAELDRRANQIAQLLLDRGVARGDRVGFYIDKSLESVLAIYGILKAGAAYVPFDPQAPPARLGYIAGDAGISHLLTGASKRRSWDALVAGGAPLETLIVLDVDEPAAVTAPEGVRLSTAREIGSFPDSKPVVAGIDLDLAYILYTSGSTGSPKGVMLSHLNALAFVAWAVEHFRVGGRDRLSSHAPFHFDLSIFDLFAAALSGATVVLVPPETSMFPAETAKFIADNGITIWYSVPSILSMMTQRGGLKDQDFTSLRAVLFAGEVFPTKYLRILMEVLPDVRFCNLYGPTETNVCTYYDVEPIPAAQREPIPIGRAIDNVEVFAVDENDVEVRDGEVGELLVRGATVMQGYWRDSARTAKTLVANRWRGELRDAVYRTGDLVKRQPDGNYLFLGRRDHQIKSRGYRIELGDIESALYAHPEVVECAVIAVPDELVTNRIEAYLVVRNGVEDSSLVRFCADRIPRYMIPERFTFVAALPKTSTGKVDRHGLRSMNPSTDEAPRRKMRTRAS